MSEPPVFVRRFERVTRALRILTMHPDGLPLSRLAAELDVDELTLREEIVAFYRAEIDPAFDPSSFRQVRIEFLSSEGGSDEVEPADAEIVRASTEQPSAEIGVVHTSPAELANVYRAGQALLSLEPENDVLKGALDALGVTMLQGIRPVDDYWKAELAGTLLDAIHNRRWVRISYSPAWRVESRDQVIAPHRLLRTRRGWEVDAGLSADGREVVGSFLLSGIREATTLEETFERSDDIDRRIAENRHEQAVEVVVPQDSRWVVDRFAERADVLAEDEEVVKLRAHLLPPVERRLGTLLLVAGADAFVTNPAELVGAGRDLARELLEHHRRSPRGRVDAWLRNRTDR